jgi:hypothetical protein
MKHLKAPIAWIPLLFLVLGACARQDASEPSSSAFGRKVLGVAVGYDAVAADAAELSASLTARRNHAWRVFRETVQPVPIDLAAHRPEPVSPQPVFVPKWQTWYDLDEISAIFGLLYGCLSPEERALLKEAPAQLSISDEQADRAIAALANRRLPASWDDRRFLERLDALKDERAVAGLSGVAVRGITLYSPAAVRHILKNAGYVMRCRDGGDCLGEEFPVDATIIKATFTEQRLGTAVFATDAAAAASIYAPTRRALEGSWIGDDRSLPVVQITPDEARGRIYSVEYFNGSAVSNGYYHLTGLHIITKEIADWVWATFWWSDRPDADFGEDRPAYVRDELAPEWSRYKMCVATDFAENDRQLLDYVRGTAASYPGPHTSLYAATKEFMLRSGAAADGTTATTWCSNPYIEHMAAGAGGNCIGCHQFAGTDAIPERGDVRARMLGRSPADFVTAFRGNLRSLSKSVTSTAFDVDLRPSGRCAL